MTFTVEHDQLEIRFELDTEPEELDLTLNALGDQILTLAAEEILKAWGQEQSPSGDAWAPLRPATIARKPAGTAMRIGIITGDMLDPSRILDGPREIGPRWAVVGYAHDGRRSPSWGKAHGFHNGSPGRQEQRPIVGWSEQAKESARQLIQSAITELRIGE